MILVFHGHSFQYEVEAVSKLFFPCVLFGHEEGTAAGNRDGLIITRMKTGRTTTSLLAVVRSQGKTYRARRVVTRKTAGKAELERLLCTALYCVLQQLTGIEAPWGIMTGIRPVKQLNYLTDRGTGREEARRIFQQEYLVSERKMLLCEETARRQAPILHGSGEKSWSLYISIPFCPSRCSYCSFVSSSITNPKAKAMMDPYVDRLCDELREIKRQTQGLALRLESIYIGGGTPTALPAGLLRRVIETVGELFLCDTVKEYTIEAGRADSIDREKLAVIKSSGADRISINPQTFSDSVLQNIGRRHTAQQVIDCYNTACRMGFAGINMDLIAGLPGDTLHSFMQTIDKAVELSPSNITVHTLSIKRSSSLFTPEGLQEGLAEQETGSMVEYALQKLGESGYRPYYLYRQKNTLQNLENVGYAKPGFEGRYNIYIMEEVHSILAAGAGAVSKLIRPGSVKVKRIFNYKYPYEYLSRFDEVIRRKNAVHCFYIESS